VTAPLRATERIEVSGIVQGVGFRPFVHRLAGELGLDGEVGNDSTKVFIDVAGPAALIDDFARRLATEAPPLALIESVVRRPGDGPIRPGFRIVASEESVGARTLVPPDTAVCDDCLAELFDPDDRRYGHPFITCTNCGPRFTIIRDLPYDRPATTMAEFDMCDACAAEYADPTDRRHHAQPIACHDCGPTLTLHEVSEFSCKVRGGEAIEGAVALLRRGGTVAIKGLGGFHLACDATSAAAVARLRRRKHRPDKPFAIMVADLAAARELAHVDDVEAAELTSPARPVVLLRARHDTSLSDSVAPGNPVVGIMLPYTPVHHLLVSAGLPPLVMTSGNVSGEPIVHRDDEVEERLGHLCDAVLTHDRPIHVPCDDSVVRVVDGGLLPIRRARGYAPVPVPLDRGRRTVLAVGGELKNTCCLASTDHAWVSQHVGDMEHLPTIEAFESIVASFTTMYEVEPDVVAVDAHPGYATRRWATRSHPDRVVEVQHHHAHIASVMAEHRLDPTQPVIGFAFDGTGYGTDGAIWGGEVLRATAEGFDRLAHLEYVPLPGGDASIRNPYRTALAHLRAAGVEWDDDLPPVAETDTVERGLLTRQLETGFSCVPTSSLGRWFDAVASLLGLRHRISFEAQAAIDLEVAARSAHQDRPYDFDIDADEFSPQRLFRAIVDDLRAGIGTPEIARGAHLAVADVVGRLAERSRDETGTGTVALSGGVFQNALLAELCVRRLRPAGFEVLTHRRVPPNDGGLALGQAYIAAHRPDPRAGADNEQETD
jgi:hydrogenase maturation protein HypF